MSLKQTICYRCLKDGPMPKLYDWICPECTLKDSQRHVITVQEKAVLDAAIQFYHADDNLAVANESEDAHWFQQQLIAEQRRDVSLLELREAVAKIVGTA